ncbi:rCG63137 [Rattus norvegicus]|uniref:RCG63137 n=1 Tax=Rattus norvegicus TaxID=10116 RepID=A6K9G1_RAT|nr:rCG63137 [Rattus norvegicus]
MLSVYLGSSPVPRKVELCQHKMSRGVKETQRQ